MHLLQALLLWFLVSTLVIGGALAFRRLFPLESPWFGFILPPLAFVIVLNFIEHFIALPHLLILLPVLIGFIGWFALSTKYSRHDLLLPTIIFLGSFAFTFGIRCLEPDILNSSDGLSDLNKINNYCQGGILPPVDSWMPPYHYVWYYSLQHYAASITKRLFNVPVGVSYNLTHALLSAMTCVVGAAAAHRFSGGKWWITFAIPFLIVSAATGSSAYLILTSYQPNEWLFDNLSGGVIAPPNDHTIWKWLALDPYRERLELQPPGFWTWRDEYHANMAGHFLTLFAVFVVAELGAVRRSLWPWIMAVLIPMLAVISSTWAYPITFLLCWGMGAIALLGGRRPAPLALAGAIVLGGILLLWPSFYDVTSSPQVPDIMWTKPEWAAPWREFLVQWWPIILLWLFGCFYLRSSAPAIRWILFVVPLMLTGVEWISVEGRYNTVEKMWGYTYGTALVALFPIVAQRAHLEEVGNALIRPGMPRLFTLLVQREGRACRILTFLLLFSAAVTLYGRLYTSVRWAPWNGGIAQLEGTHYITVDNQKRNILQVLTQVKGLIFLSGKCIWCYNESPAPAVFTGNRSYIAWTYFESVADYPDEATRREKLNNDFYSGAIADPLKFLQANKISGVLIWPDDDISDDFLATLTRQLDPSYEYIDCRSTGTKNAGVFLLRPLPDSVR